MKFSLISNSHALSNFQTCESLYLHKDLLRLESLTEKPALKRGSIISKWLALYYYNKIKPHQMIGKVLANPTLWTHKIAVETAVSEQEAFKVYATLIAYSSHYKNETWKPLGVEKGFSKVLYEDSENLFVYEGRIDLIAMESQPIVIDHKHQKQKYSIYQFNNQSRGYCWATGYNTFAYNYLKLTQTEQFRREVYLFSQDQIADWVSNTTEWYFRLKHAVQKQKFLPSWNCTTVYGVCPFHTLCEQPKENVKNFILKSQFKIGKKYRSW